MKEKLINKAATTAATAAGGPAAGKAADIASKQLMGKNTPNDKSKSRLSNALNKKNSFSSPSMPGLSNKSGGQKKDNQENNDEPEKELSASEKIKKGIKDNVVGKSTNQQNLSEAEKLAIKAKKIAKVVKFLMPIMPYLLIAVAVVLVALIIMAQIMVLRDKVEAAAIGVSTGVEKYINFMSGEGWVTEEDKFFKTLQEKYDESLTLATESGEVIVLDIPIVAATINYNKITNVGLYEDLDGQDIGEEDDDSAVDDSNDLFSGYLENKQMRNFYYVANDKLGDYKSLIPGNRRLLGHMIGYKIVWKDVSVTNPDFLAQWAKLAVALTVADIADYEQMFNVDMNIFTSIGRITGIPQIYGLIKTIKEMIAYDSLGENHDSYFDYYSRTFWYELEELGTNFNKFFESDKYAQIGDDPNLFQGILDALTSFPTPYIYFYETMDMKKTYNYGHYLKEVYFPGTFFSKGNYNETSVNAMVREVYEQRDYYDYLLGDLGSDNQCVDSVNEDCGYDLSTVLTLNGKVQNDDSFKTVKNIKVNLVGYYDEKDKMLDEGIPFEKYILGVVYAEVDGFNDEAQKAQAVAARSFALVRPFEMGSPSFCNFKKNGDGWILTLRGSTADQVYCDPEKGCSSSHGNFNGADMYPGESAKAYKYKGPIASDAPVRNNVAATTGQVVMTEEGHIILANFVNTAQEAWQELGATRKYTDFLPEYYTSRVNGHTISIGEGNCNAINGSSQCSSTAQQNAGEWSNWRQFDSAWANNPLGNSTIGAIGCAATSVTIQLKRSGISTDFKPMDPGGFVAAFDKIGGFTAGGGIYFSRVNELVPNFNYIKSVGLSGSAENKIELVAQGLSEGCYPVMEVKKGDNSGQHWVAVLEVKDGKIIMADPASAETDVIAKYGSAGLSEYICYKVGG